MRALEDQRAREEKHRMQEQTKADLDFSLRLKMKRKVITSQEYLIIVNICLCFLGQASTRRSCNGHEASRADAAGF